MATATNLRGTIKSIKRAEGYGFIAHNNTGADYFFHRSTVNGMHWEELVEDMQVVFDEIESPKGPRAGNVSALEDED